VSHVGFAERMLRAAYLGGARRDCLEREKSHRGSGGFTLLEVLVGATILAVALLAMTAMFPVGYTNITEAGKMTMAITGARQVFEEVSALPFDNIINLNGFDTLDPATLQRAILLLFLQGLYRHLQVLFQNPSHMKDQNIHHLEHKLEDIQDFLFLLS